MLFHIDWSLTVVYSGNGNYREDNIAHGRAYGDPHIAVTLVGNMLSELPGLPPKGGCLVFKTTDPNGAHCRMAIYENGHVSAQAYNINDQEEYEDD